MDYEETLNKIYDLVKRNSNLFGNSSYEITILPGWIPLVESLLDAIQKELKPSERIQIVQIKDANGPLKIAFGMHGISEDRQQIFQRLVGLTEFKSSQICSLCGNTGTLDDRFWVSVKCELHKNAQSAFEQYSVTAQAKHEDRMTKLLKLA